MGVVGPKWAWWGLLKKDTQKRNSCRSEVIALLFVQLLLKWAKKFQKQSTAATFRRTIFFLKQLQA